MLFTVAGGALAVGLLVGLVIGRFALTPSQVQVSGTVSVTGQKQTAQLVFAYIKDATVPGCNNAALAPPVCYGDIKANVTAQSAYSVALPNNHLFTISTLNATDVNNLNATSTCNQEIFFTLETLSSTASFDVSC